MNLLQSLAAPAGRVLLSLIFIVSGLGKIFGYAGTAAYMSMMGVPGALLPIVIIVELGCGIMLLLGYRVQIAAVLLAGFSLVAGVLFHLLPGLSETDAMMQQLQQIMFLKNVTIAGGLAYVFAYGAGKYSIDSRRFA